MSNHPHPFIWEVFDKYDLSDRITTLVAHTEVEAQTMLNRLHYGKEYVLRNSGKRKPPGKCCDKCKDHPCEG